MNQMKKIIYLCCVWTLMLQGCSSDDSSTLSSQTKELEDAGAGMVNPDMAPCKKILCEATGGWKMEYEPVDGDTYTFYFRFQENGLVETDSDIPEAAIFTIFDFEPNAEQLNLKLQGGGHLRLLGEEKMEEVLKVSSFSATQITCVGAKHGRTMNLTPAGATEIKEMQNQKKALVALMNQGLLRGTMREGGKLVAHYTLDHRKEKVMFTYFEGRSLKHKEVQLQMAGGSFSWEEVAMGAYKVSGMTYNETTNQVQINGTAVQNLVLATNAGVVAYFDNRGRQFQLSKTNGVGDAKDELFDETAWSFLKTIEINCTMGKRPLVACLEQGYIFYDVSANDNDPLTKDAPDVVYFQNLTGGVPLYGATPAHKTEANQKLSKFIDAWFHLDGLILVQVDEASEGYLYFLSPTTDSWFKVKKTKG